jgi:hypothetical protein
MAVMSVGILEPKETPEKTLAKVLHDWKYDSITNTVLRRHLKSRDLPQKTDTFNIARCEARNIRRSKKHSITINHHNEHWIYKTVMSWCPSLSSRGKIKGRQMHPPTTATC